jgi:hypothetical protein
MSTPSLSMQRQSIEHLLGVLESQGKRTKNDRWREMIETARYGCRTLAWIERREELIKKLVALEEAEPLLAEIVRAFPHATLREVVTECQS